MPFTYDPSKKPGELAAAALCLAKQQVADMQSMLRRGEYDRLSQELAQVCGAPVTLSPADLRDAVDELVCFRVYMRVYLGKYRLPGVAREQAMRGFRARLPELEAALRKPGQERMTVLPTELDARVRLDETTCQTLLSLSSLCQLLLFDMLRAGETGGGVLSCPLCKGCFAARRSDVVYCPDCRPGGARTARANAVRSDPLLEVFTRARQRVYTAKSRGKLSANEAAAAVARMEKALADARTNGSSADELEVELCRIHTKKVTNCY